MPLVIIIIVICATVSITKKIKQEKKNKASEHVDDTETYIPESVMNAHFNCPKCGASIPLSSDKKHVAMFCSFCGAQLKDANKLMEQAHQNKQEERAYQVRLKELEEKEREHEREMQRLRNERSANSAKTTRLIVLMIITIIGLACIFGPIIWLTNLLH